MISKNDIADINALVEESPVYVPAELNARWALIKGYKTGQPCSDCGGHFPSECLDFDHIPERGPKRFEISRGANYSLNDLAEEIAKCEIVCANCHRIRTVRRRRRELDK